MSALPLPIEAEPPQGPSRRRELLPLVFGQPAAVAWWSWTLLWLAGLLLPGGALLAARHLPPPTPELAPLVVELSPPPPPPPPAPEPPRHEPKVPNPQPPAAQKAPRPALAPNLRARAGRILARQEAAPVSAPGDSMVTGEAETYAGGVTASAGTSEQAVEEVPPPAPPPPPPPPPVDGIAATRAYLGRIKELLAREKRYPLVAQRRGLEGTVVVSFVIDETGRFSQVAVLTSAGNDLLDDSACETVRELSGRVQRPGTTGKIALTLKAAIRYELAS
jgi:protein TonB